MPQKHPRLIARPCFQQDLRFVQLIYAHAVETGTGTFEIEPPSLDEMTKRWSAIVDRGWPFVVASPPDVVSRVVAFAYAVQYRDRAAYAKTFEVSVYAAHTSPRTGAGSVALAEVLTSLRLVMSRARLPITHNLLVAFALLFAIQANSQVAIGGAIMAPMLAMLLARTEQYATMRSTISDPPRSTVTLIAVALFFASAIPIITFGQAQMARNLDKRYPVHAVAYMEANALTSRVLADTVEASYLIHRHIPVYIGGRMDLYRDRFFFRWWLAERGAPDWEKVDQEAHPEVILLRRTAALRQLLLATGTWKLAYDDPRYSVLLPQAHPLPAVAAVTVDYQPGDGGPSLNFLE